MNTDVKVINNLSSKELYLEDIIVFCVNIFADPNKSHSGTTMIDSPSTRMIRIERTPDTPTQVYALHHYGSLELAEWIPVTVTWSE